MKTNPFSWRGRLFAAASALAMRGPTTRRTIPTHTQSGAASAFVLIAPTALVVAAMSEPLLVGSLKALSNLHGPLAFCGGLSVGLTMGWVQQMRGMHFLSHTLATAWLSTVLLFAMLSIFWKWLNANATPTRPQ
ncbi:hypothetical protein [Rhodoferax fermentans]|uniref:Uncharacterized protein n=1 Tax=Rhodoferax fermentans TaxID=28066 RepID=A0A1T1AR61_RHOFE|nr:hypothetical protein [Rhodoferax fermentans]MBK1684763.1 hypothetical protein [Rhodoferax fermentans]OOV06602.1 hypothetical protein RF819_07525 [Rhodoferax fermentans]